MGYVGKVLSICDLKKMDTFKLVSELINYVQQLNLNVGKSQEKSWKECICYLKNTFENNTEYDNIYIAFEYCIPLSSYRRPDVLLFYENKVLVLEFKRKNVSLEIDESQLKGYLNQLRNYHEITKKLSLEIQGCLVVTESKKNCINKKNNIDIVEGVNLIDYLKNIDKNDIKIMSKNNVDLWLSSEYMPLLDIIKATTSIFLNDDIPQIKNIEYEKIKNTQEFILDSIKNNNSKKKIFFLTGVPGSGKTLILLNILYDLNKNYTGKNIQALFTSGNGPLIKTISYILSKDKFRLDGSSLVKEIKDIKNDLYNKIKDSPEINKKSYQTILFDESQRSWDLNHMKRYKYKISEPELLMKLQNKAFNDNGSCNLICSYGEGQSIYLGEESGFEIWPEVLNRKDFQEWEVYCSEELAHYFKDRKNKIICKKLNLDTSIRGNFININSFVKKVLDVNETKSEEELNLIYNKGFDIKISRDFSKIRNYLKEYEDQCSDEFYGLITSSNSSINTLQETIPEFKGILSQHDNPRIGSWYVSDCKNLDEAVTEFGSQGLELNIPVVIFGRDYIIKNKKWIISADVLKASKKGKIRTKIEEYKDEDQIFKNIYRVLLTRGRKGLILFLPDRCKNLNETYEFFKKIGVKELI